MDNNKNNKLTFIKPYNWHSLPFYMKIRYYADTMDERYAIYVDKIEAKKIVQEITNGQIKTTKLVKILKNIDDINVSDINPNCLLKSAHASGWNLDLAKTPNLDEIKGFLSKYNKIYTIHEKQYTYLKPRFYIEEKINDLYTGLSGKAVVFMIRCFHGIPITIGVKFETTYFDEIEKSNKKQELNLLYDTNWNYITQTKVEPRFSSIRFDKPPKLDIMLENARKLSSRFEFVRIDYYIDKQNDVYFSEFTFTPSGGDITFDIRTEYALASYW
jgi:hypothetical protein